MAVISLLQLVSVSFTSKFCSSRFGAAMVLRESVVTRNFRIIFGMIPAWCISIAMVFHIIINEMAWAWVLKGMGIWLAIQRPGWVDRIGGHFDPAGASGFIPHEPDKKTDCACASWMGRVIVRAA